VSVVPEIVGVKGAVLLTTVHRMVCSWSVESRGYVRAWFAALV
jgi:hypothetical protein